VVEEPPAEFDTLMDSMADPYDPDALAAENERLTRLRKQKRDAEIAAAERAAAVRAEALGASHEARRQAETGPTRSARRRQPPHRAAANTADAVVDTGAGNEKAARPRPSTALGEIDGKEVFAVEPQTISKRGVEARRAAAAAGTPKINEGPTQGGSTNPRFRRGT
jgi:hypothetical protein